MLRLDRVSKSYRVGTFGGRELVAVHDVSLQVRPGEVISLIGESGSGKSTIGRMILRLTSVTGGTISFDGEDVAAFKGARLRAYYGNVQGVFQDPFSCYTRSSRPTGCWSCCASRTSLAWAGAAGGPRWRGRWRRCASTRIDVLNLLGDLKARGLGILFITHDLSLGNYLSDTAVILHRGEVVETGPTDQVFGQPEHPYTRSLLASVPQLHRKWDRAGHAVPEPAEEGG
jgi:ABC-type oligopeptide transport system ATPase subunit